MDNSSLLEALKNELFITWEDEETDKRLERIIISAIFTMNYKLGIDFDYNIGGMEQYLFLQYCVYAYNGCANEFDENYYHEINQLRMLHEVEQNEEE